MALDRGKGILYSEGTARPPAWDLLLQDLATCRERITVASDYRPRVAVPERLTCRHRERWRGHAST
jgi:hypothetical protein